MARLRTAVLASCFALLSLAGPADAAFPGANGKIAFGVGGSEIYTINPDGSGQTFLAPGRDPAWSADGTKLAYINPAGHLAVMNADGSGQIDLGVGPQGPYEFAGIVNPVWSPDGQEIAFENWRETVGDQVYAEVYVVSGTVYNGPTTRLPFCDFCMAEEPSWSPGGGWIAAHVNDGETDGIKRIKRDGSALTDVHAGTSPDWSPDGFKLAIATDSPITAGSAIAAVGSDGTGFAVLDAPPSGRADAWPAWSADRTKIAFTQAGALYVMNADGTGKSLIKPAPSPRSIAVLSWQPIPYNGYPRPRGASPFQTYLVPAYKQCSAPNSTHGAPLSFGSCNRPQPASDYLTVGTPDANGQGARSRGLIKYAVRANDILIQVSITDVRNKSGLADYAGGLRWTTIWRLTDRYNGPSLEEPATTIDITAPFDVPCTTTADTATGSTCLLTTGANTLVPGMVRPDKRMVLELGPAQVYDGGADGDTATADNTLFLTQGLFVP